jgi:hypothetical protein
MRFLPSYSPAFNPIEKAFPKLKALLRRAAEEPPSDPSTHFGKPSCALPPDHAERMRKFLRRMRMRSGLVWKRFSQIFTNKLYVSLSNGKRATTPFFQLSDFLAAPFPPARSQKS